MTYDWCCGRTMTSQPLVGTVSTRVKGPGIDCQHREIMQFKVVIHKLEIDGEAKEGEGYIHTVYSIRGVIHGSV